MFAVGFHLHYYVYLWTNLFICALETGCLKPTCNESWWVHGLHRVVVVGSWDWNSAQIPSVTILVVEELPNSGTTGWLQLCLEDKCVILYTYIYICVCVCVCMYLCMHIWKNVFMKLWVCVCFRVVNFWLFSAFDVSHHCLRHVCGSIRPHGTTPLLPDRCSRNILFE
jgi:hypothetical protein